MQEPLKREVRNVYIHEAIQATTAKLPCVTRRRWDRLSKEPMGGIKIQPTNSPDGCIIESDVNKGIRRIWQPTTADLVADDWEPVRL